MILTVKKFRLIFLFTDNGSYQLSLAHMYLCGGYFSKGKDILDWSNSKKHLEAALKLYDKDPVSYTLLAAVSYELKEDDKVIDYYWKAFELDFLATLHDWRSSAAVVGVYVLRGKFDEAKNILDLQLDLQQDFFPEIKNSKKFQVVKDYYEKALQKANNSDIARSS